MSLDRIPSTGIAWLGLIRRGCDYMSQCELVTKRYLLGGGNGEEEGLCEGLDIVGQREPIAGMQEMVDY